jgi:hypothetical protein
MYMQAYTAPQRAGYAGRLVAARMDVPRFRKVNTAKGPWRLLDALATAPHDTGPLSGTGGAVPAAPSNMAAVGAPTVPAAGQGGQLEEGSRMQLEDVRRIVRAVAVDIVGEEALEGEKQCSSTLALKILFQLSAVVTFCSTTC